jgi:prepilin peptidase CpaA
LILQGLLVVTVVLAAVFDLGSRRIPNVLTVPAALCGLAAHFGLSGSLGVLWSVLGAALGGGIYLAFYQLGAMGGGDVKLMFAVGAIVGPQDWIIIFVVTALFGGAVAAVVVVRRGRVRETLSGIGVILGQLARFRAPRHARPELDIRSEQAITMPHGASIAAASIAFLIWTWARSL